MTGATLDDLRGVLADMHGQPLSLGGARGRRVMESIHRLASGTTLSDGELSAALAPERKPIMAAGRGATLIPSERGKWKAVLHLHGIANPRLDFPPFAFSTLAVAQNVKELSRNPDIDCIWLDISSPGGAVVSTPEAASAILDARKIKPVFSHTEDLMASAAWWIGSAATRVTANKSANLIAQGVFLLHLSYAGMLARDGVEATFVFAGEHKIDGNAYQSPSRSWIDFETGEINKIYEAFLGDVAKARNLPTIYVREHFGKGRCLMAPDALRVRAIDAVCDFSTAMRVTPNSYRADKVAKAKATLATQSHYSDMRRRKLQLAKAKVEAAKHA